MAGIEGIVMGAEIIHQGGGRELFNLEELLDWHEFEEIFRDENLSTFFSQQAVLRGQQRTSCIGPSFRSAETAKKVGRIILDLLSIIGIFIANLGTAGMFSFIGSLIQYSKIKKVEASQGISKSLSVDKSWQYAWVEPLFKKTEKDADTIEGGFLQTEVAKDGDGHIIFDGRVPRQIPLTPEAAILFDKRELPDLVEAVFDWAFDDLSRDPKNGVIFNDSRQILHAAGKAFEGEFKDNRHALHNWMVYFLMKSAGLEVSCDRTVYRVVFNQDLKIQSSEACHVKDKNGDKIVTFYRNEDAWTPKLESAVSDGIDPISIKWILEKIKEAPDLLGHLEVLLLQALIPNNDPSLKAAQQLLLEKSEASRLVNAALVLIDDMSLVLEENFQEIIRSKWRERATGRDPSVTPAPPKRVAITKPKRYAFKKRKALIWQRVKRVAFTILAMTGVLFANILTLGLFTLGTACYQHYRLKKLEKEMAGAASISSRKPTARADEGVWLERVYRKQSSDNTTIPVESEKLQKLLESNLEEFQEMAPLLESAFNASYHQLRKMSDDSTWDLIFNDSSKIYQEYAQVAGMHTPKYQANMNALYNWMALSLVELAGMEKDCDGVPYLYFNDHLKVRYSQPCRIPTREGSEITFFLYKDGWTPEEGGEDIVRNGIDPVAVKWIVERLKRDPQAYDALKVLFLDALIEDGTQMLQEAKEYAAQEGEMAGLIRCAYELISNIGLSLGKKYQPLFYERWETLAVDEGIEPLYKESAFNLDALSAERDWFPSGCVTSDLQIETFKTKTLLQPVWKNLESVRLKSAGRDVQVAGALSIDPNEALNVLSKQYFWIHAGINLQGCLLSALAVHLFQGGNGFNPQLIKNAMAYYLDQRGADFVAEIDQATKLNNRKTGYPGWTIEEYQNWLLSGKSPENKESRSHYDMGDLEIELFCKTFGIKVQVFEAGRPCRIEEGMLLPTRSYGPTTFEKLTLLNVPNFSFYALMPKLREPKDGDDEEMREALRHNRDFWSANNGTEYGSQIKAVPRPQPKPQPIDRGFVAQVLRNVTANSNP